MTITLLNTASGLLPIYPSDFDQKKKLKIGATYVADIKEPRSPLFHRKFFALVRMAFDNLPEQYDSIFTNVDCLRREIIMRAGYFDTHVNIKGERMFFPKSIAFSEMDDIEFSELYSKSIDVVLKYFLPDNNREEIENEILNFM